MGAVIPGQISAFFAGPDPPGALLLTVFGRLHIFEGEVDRISPPKQNYTLIFSGCKAFEKKFY